MRKILFITEGQNDEVKFINRLFKVCNYLQNYKIYPYKTNLHNLANLLVINGEIDDSLDIKQVLKENEKDDDLRKMLSEEFSDIILIFDFEPHQDFPRFELIRKLLLFFDNSTTNGKLYINYPMMQSYRHFDKLPNKDFKNLIITKKDSHKYKSIVGDFSKFQNIEHHSYSLFVSLAYHHLLKLNFILNNKFELPNKNFVREWKQVDLFDTQYRNLLNNDHIFVINTFILFFIEFNVNCFYTQITRHKTKYSIL